MNTITSPQYNLRKPRIKPILDANELLFFSNQHDPTPIKNSPASESNFFEKNNFIRKIGNMSTAEKRSLRSGNDLRYLPTKNSKNTKNNESNEIESSPFCLEHLTDQCNRSVCNKWHQMRNPRIFGVCKFYITDSCSKGSFCEFMHSDFPCRYYHLNINHDEQKCRFKHGGPLKGGINRYFTKHIEHWVKQLTKDKPHEYEKALEEYLTKFEEQQIHLEQECKDENILMSEVNEECDKEFALERVLARNQIDMLSEKGFRTAAEVNSIPVDELLSFGLTIDQIYEISKNTSCNKVAGDKNQSKNALSIDLESSIQPSENTFFSDESNKTSQPHDLNSEFSEEINDLKPQQTVTNNSDSEDEDKLIINEEE